MNKPICFLPAFWVMLLATGIGINSQLPAFLSEYTFNGDVAQHIYWMQQFRDNELFTDDLLTKQASATAPWGFLLFYYLGSFIIDPLTLSKVVPIILFILSSVYVFKLVQSFADTYTGFLAALFFMVVPNSIAELAGGLQRGFAMPLLVAFLYYLVKRDYTKTSVVLVLQSVFYPMLFFLEALTYLFAYLLTMYLDARRARVPLLEEHKRRTMSVLLGIGIGLAAVLAWHWFTHDPSRGVPLTHSQMLNMPELYSGGRFAVLPTPSIGEAVIDVAAIPYEHILRRYSYHVTQLRPYVKTGSIIIVMMIAVFIIGQLIRAKISIPREFACLLLASVIMYIAADVLLFRLFIPTRYVGYTGYLLAIMCGAIVLSHLTRLAGERWPRHFLRATVVVLMVLHFNLSKGAGLIDMSENKVLYEYLRTLPKAAMIAAPPFLADYIPTFAGRKVFINFKMSLPVFDKYWNTIRGRTVAFFDAYYSPDRLSVYEFCRKNGIDYLVVRTRDFSEQYLQAGQIYFEPFNGYVKSLVADRSEFALVKVPERVRAFSDGDVFVIHRSVLNGAD